MNYVDQNLNRDEVVVYRTGLHWMILIKPIILAVFLLMCSTGFVMGAVETKNDYLDFAAACLALLSFAIVAVSIIRRNSVEMAVTNKRVIIKSGIIRNRSLELFLLKVESIAVDQGLIGRMFNYGDIVVRGTGGTAEPFRKVRSPLEFRHRVQEQSEALTTL